MLVEFRCGAAGNSEAVERLAVATCPERGHSSQAWSQPGSAGRPPWAQALGNPWSQPVALLPAAQAAYNGLLTTPSLAPALKHTAKSIWNETTFPSAFQGKHFQAGRHGDRYRMWYGCLSSRFLPWEKYTMSECPGFVMASQPTSLSCW